MNAYRAFLDVHHMYSMFLSFEACLAPIQGAKLARRVYNTLVLLLLLLYNCYTLQHTHPTTINICSVGCPGAVVVSNSTYIQGRLKDELLLLIHVIAPEE